MPSIITIYFADPEEKRQFVADVQAIGSTMENVTNEKSLDGRAISMAAVIKRLVEEAREKEMQS